MANGLRLVEASRVATDDPDFTRLMTEAMRSLHIEALKRAPKFGDVGFGTRLLASHYAKTPAKGNPR